MIARAEARGLDDLAKLVVSRIQAVDGVTRTTRRLPDGDASGRSGRRAVLGPSYRVGSGWAWVN